MAVICSGLPALLNLCSSGIISKSQTIDYLVYDNSYDVDKYRGPDPQKINFALEIAESLGYSLRVHGPYEWHCPPTENQLKGEKIIFEKPVSISVDSSNLVSQNTLLFIKNLLKGTKVDIFPEGASCFHPFRPRGNGITSPYYSLIRPHISSLYRKYLSPSFKVNNIWLLPDPDSYVSKNIFPVPRI